jgi:hypothetical protein
MPPKKRLPRELLRTRPSRLEAKTHHHQNSPVIRVVPARPITIMRVPNSKARHDPDKNVDRAVLAHVPKPRLKYGTVHCYLGRASPFGLPCCVSLRPIVPCHTRF